MAGHLIWLLVALLLIAFVPIQLVQKKLIY